MGNQQALAAVDPVHARMYLNLVQIQDPAKRVQVIQTCLSAMEYVHSAKRAGVYSHLLHYVSVVSSGGRMVLPGEAATAATPLYQTHPNQSQSTPVHAAHPSLRGGQSQSQSQSQQLQVYDTTQPSWKVVAETPQKKALSYFSSCLEVLGIQEEVALTEEALKKAYKRAALKAHPDKGGSEELFEAVTRAYAYLSEILRHLQGRKTADAPKDTRDVQSARAAEAEQWKHVEPVRLSAKNLDMNKFNELFEQTHLPDPDADGYGSWLKEDHVESNGTTKRFSGSFNRDVFNRMFVEEARKSGGSQAMVVHPGEMALTLNPSGGTELVAERPSSFTAAANARVQYTDLRGAYSTEATISDKVAGVTVSERKLDEYRASRERAPDPLTSDEMRGIQAFEERQRLQESIRERKKAEAAVQQAEYFQRMKRLVITDGTDLNAGRR